MCGALEHMLVISLASIWFNNEFLVNALVSVKWFDLQYSVDETGVQWQYSAQDRAVDLMGPEYFITS